MSIRYRRSKQPDGVIEVFAAEWSTGWLGASLVSAVLFLAALALASPVDLGCSCRGGQSGSATQGLDRCGILRSMPEDNGDEFPDGEPKFGCLGLVVKGPAATVVMGGLVLLIIYLIGRCGG